MSKQNNVLLSQLPPLALYIHIPWCVQKCPYCDFNSHTLKPTVNEMDYVEFLLLDLEAALPQIWGRTVYSIFIGGGTPSLFSGDAIDKLLSGVRKLVRLSPFAEITLEANPGTVDNQHFKDYSISGVNRISLGIQSFNDNHLLTLGRIHDSAAAVQAITKAQQYFTQINLDLMYGLPNQTIEQLQQDITWATSFNTSHLSFYNLTIEPNTKFFVDPPKNIPDNDQCYLMQNLIVEALERKNFKRYEVSAYAQNNNYSKHNLNYWLFGDYLGIGAGAHSKISQHDKIIRQVRQKHPQTYMTKVANAEHISEDVVVDLKDLPFEFMLNALRLIDGFNTNLFVERTGLSLNVILPKLNQALEQGFIKFEQQKIVPTVKGINFLNEALMLFLD
jgi:putative oxygen-independent coproporphyrinogen III oxidase